jgi:hypothetical protein
VPVQALRLGRHVLDALLHRLLVQSVRGRQRERGGDRQHTRPGTHLRSARGLEPIASTTAEQLSEPVHALVAAVLAGGED